MSPWVATTLAVLHRDHHAAAGAAEAAGRLRPLELGGVGVGDDVLGLRLAQHAGRDTPAAAAADRLRNWRRDVLMQQTPVMMPPEATKVGPSTLG